MRTLQRFLLVAVALASATSTVVANPCTVPDNGGGTVTLPPVGCDYLSPDDVHRIIDGLPPGTTIELAPIHRQFINIITTGDSITGEETEQFNSSLTMELHGTGTLLGFNRTVNVPIQCLVHSGPRTPGSPVQSFATEMLGAQGQIVGDPDFDLLRITAGTNFGMPSPGHTTLTRLGPPGSNWNVDSFFDVFYRIDFVGRNGGPLTGMSGSTTGTIRMQTGFVSVFPVVPSANAWGQVGLTLLVLGLGIAVLQRRLVA